MDFRGQVWKRVWKMEYFGLKLGTKNSEEYPPPHPPRRVSHPGTGPGTGDEWMRLQNSWPAAFIKQDGGDRAQYLRESIDEQPSFRNLFFFFEGR